MKRFDLSDIEPPIDTLDDVLDIAAGVLADYGGERGDSRIERLARWIAANVGGEPYSVKTIEQHCDRVEPHEYAYAVVRVGSLFGVDTGQDEVATIAVWPEGARAFAVGLLRLSERADAA